MAWPVAPSAASSSVPIVAPTPDALADAAARLRRGELVAFPTETVYGLGAHALDAEAVARIYAAKGRPAWNPVIVHVAQVADARALVADWPERAERLAAACWPGPLTLVLPRSARVPSIVTAGTETVAVRIPDHPVALALLAASGLPLAAPSANRFTAVSPTTAEHVARGLGERVSLILDGGPCAVGIESTVLDLTAAVPTILRPGGLDADTIARVLGEPVQQRDAGADAAIDDTTPRASPGLAARHYAPNAEVWLVPVTDSAAVQTAVTETVRAEAARVGVIAIDDGLTLSGAHHTIRLPRRADAFARGLYAALHRLEEDGCTLIVIEAPPPASDWNAVRDRLQRATR
jgi:L-threonylcarbamoyladenylate synthase